MSLGHFTNVQITGDEKKNNFLPTIEITLDTTLQVLPSH